MAKRPKTSVSRDPKSPPPSVFPLAVDYADMGLSDIELMTDAEYAAAVARDNGEAVSIDQEISPKIDHDSTTI